MKIKLKIYCVSALALTALLLVLRTLCLFFSYDTSVGYLNHSLLSALTTVFFVIATLWCLSALIAIPHGEISTRLTPDSVAFKAVSAYSAVVALLSGSLMATVTNSTPIEKLAAISAMASALFFIFVIINKEKLELAKAFSSIILVASLVSVLASVYFELTIAMNSPHKILGGFALMSAMLFVLCETRIYLSRLDGQMATPRLHFALSLLTPTLGLPFAASAVIYRLASGESGFVTGAAILGNIGYIGIISAVSVYAVARCFTFTVLSDNRNIEDTKGNGNTATNSPSVEKQNGM